MWSRRTPVPLAYSTPYQGVLPATSALHAPSTPEQRASRKCLATSPASANGHGVLRLRGCFASRSSHSAQDDSLRKELRPKLILHFLRLLVHRNSERVKRRRIHRHGNLLQSRSRGSIAKPPSLFRDKVHEKHLAIDFESQFASIFLDRSAGAPPAVARATRPRSC